MASELLRQLVALECPTATSEAQAVLYRTTSRLLDSSLRTPPTLRNEEAVRRSLVSRLVREENEGKAARFAELAEKFEREDGGLGMEGRWRVLYLMGLLRGGDRRPGKVGRGEFRREVRGVDEEEKVLVEWRARDGVGDGRRAGRENGYGEDVERMNDSVKDRLRSGANGIVKGAVGLLSVEQVLVQDLLLVVQGVDGKMIRYESEKESFQIDNDHAVISSAMQDVVYHVAELGFLYRRIKSRLDRSKELEDDIYGEQNNASEGLVSRSFCGAVSEEMDYYFKSLVAIQKGASSLSLRRLYAWSEAEKPRLRWLARLCDETQHLAGGQIVSHLSMYHDSYVSDPMKKMLGRLLQRSAAPLARTLVRWITEGALIDPYKEFFLIEDSRVAASAAAAAASIPNGVVTRESLGETFIGGPRASSSTRVWWGLYKVRKEMVPSFLNKDVVERALLAGKSTTFLRRCCGDSTWVDQVHAVDVEPVAKLVEESFDCESIDKCVAKGLSSASERLKTLLFDKFHLGVHFAAIKNYLLLAQGDFAQALMDSLAPQLDGHAATLLRNNLTGIIDSALRSSASYQMIGQEYVADRVDVKLLPSAAARSTGWDVFSLTYRVEDAPLSTVFTVRVMDAYLRIFQFLWRLKRMDHVLCAGFTELRAFQITRKLHGPHSALFEAVLKQAHFMRMKMSHLIQNMQYYCFLEVLEGSWKTLEEEVAKGGSLDALITAHARYISIITDRSLLSERSKGVLAALDEILQTILDFRATQVRLVDALTYLQAQKGARRKIVLSDGDMEKLVSEFHHIRAQLNSIGSEYDSSFERFSDGLSRTHGSSLDPGQFLLFRLDYNEFYLSRRATSESEDVKADVALRPSSVKFAT